MSSPEQEKHRNALDRLIKFCEKHDEKNNIIQNELLPILFKLDKSRLIGLKKALTRELKRDKNE